MHHGRNTGTGSIGHLVGHQRQDQDHGRAIERGNGTTRHGEEREIGGGESDAGDEVRHEGDLPHEEGERPDIGTHHHIAGEDAQNARADRCGADDGYGVECGLPEIGAEQDAGAHGNGRQVLTDPVVEREIGPVEIAWTTHDGGQRQSEQRQANRDHEHHRGKAGRGKAPLLQPRGAVHRALGADRDEATRFACQIAIHQDRQDTNEHDGAGQHARNAGLARTDRAIERGCEHVELHRQAQHIRHAEFAKAFCENQHYGRHQRRTHQRHDHLPSHGPTGCPKDARRVLELAIEAAQGRAEQQDDEGCVVQRQDDGDRHLPIGEPIRRRQADSFKPARLATDGAVLEKCSPGKGEGPGWQHIGNDQRGGEPAAAEHIGARNQPGQDAADGHREDEGAKAHFESVEQRRPEEIMRHRRGEGALQIVERVGAHGRLTAPFVAKLDRHRVREDRDDRHGNEIEKQCGHHQADQRRGLAHRQFEPVAPTTSRCSRGRGHVNLRHELPQNGTMERRATATQSRAMVVSSRAPAWHCGKSWRVLQFLLVRTPLFDTDHSAALPDCQYTIAQLCNAVSVLRMSHGRTRKMR